MSENLSDESPEITIEYLMDCVFMAVQDRIDLWDQEDDLRDWVAPAKVILGDLDALIDRIKSEQLGGFN